MCKELEIKSKEVEDNKVATLYFGGGTPSILSEKELDLLHKTIQSKFDTSLLSEVSFEVNPEDITFMYLQHLKNIGVNRLSIGLQNSHNTALKWMNRQASAEKGREAVQLARSAGFTNLSVDLIYNLPNSTLDAVAADLDYLLSLDIQHVSAYGLTIEPQTVFGHQYKKKILLPLPEDEAAKQFSYLSKRLRASGFDHYEISNFCLPGFHAEHNSNYWKQVPYVGIGPSAHSFLGRKRMANVSNNNTYCKAILDEGTIPETVESLSAEDLANEMIITRLRTHWGLDLTAVFDATGFRLEQIRANVLEMGVTEGYFRIENKVVFLTDEGRLLADHLAMKLMIG